MDMHFVSTTPAEPLLSSKEQQYYLQQKQQSASSCFWLGFKLQWHIFVRSIEYIFSNPKNMYLKRAIEESSIHVKLLRDAAAIGLCSNIIESMLLQASLSLQSLRKIPKSQVENMATDYVASYL